MTASSYKGVVGLRRLWNALRYSKDGLIAAYRGEAAFRQEAWAAALLVPLALALPVGVAGKALMAGSVLLVLIVELLNSAVESVVDRVSMDRHELAKRAKDMGSAAVLLTLLLAGIVWMLVLWGWASGVRY